VAVVLSRKRLNAVARISHAVYNRAVERSSLLFPRPGVPELPEVETVVRDLRPELVGQTIRRVTVSDLSLRRAWSKEWESELTGRRISVIQRRGKWIFIELKGSRLLVIHLGMTGQLTIVPAERPVQPHTHVIFDLSRGGRQLRFRDVRRFGCVYLLPRGQTIDQYLEEIGLGPEPFGVSSAYWLARLARTTRNLKAILLDQRVVAGVGNIYADEALFAARLHPARRGNSLTRHEVRRLGRAVPEVLNLAIDKRGSSIRDYIGGSGLRGAFQREFRVYGRTGQPCVRCKGAIVQVRLAGRSTHFCPRCQRNPRNQAKKKGTGLVVRSTRRAVPATSPVPFF
jgi:formamidopyrimidine-DNA glycosylase